MAVMATSRMLTRAELDALPNDGLRHELIDGAFVMTPAPGVGHQRISAALFRLLSGAIEGSGAGNDRQLEVLYAPLDVVLGANVVEPDLVMAPRSAFTERDLPVAPLLVVEIRSPTTGWLDEGRKRSLYEESGVEHYWLVNPETPSITVLRLVDGRYEEVAHATGDETITLTDPVPVTLNPAQLLRG